MSGAAPKDSEIGDTNMTQLQTAMIALLRRALTGEHTPLPAEFDWELLYYLAKKHKLLPLIYEELARPENGAPQELIAQARKRTMEEAYVSEYQLREIKALREKFREENIDFVLLKGALLKHLYPKHYMRPMSDADILIRVDQYPAIAEMIRPMGYIEGPESDHELIWDKSFFHLELHKHLIPSYNDDFYAFFGDGWQLARRDAAGSSEYHFSDEDEFIFIFTHFAKHYRDGGIGVLHVLDLYVYLTAKPHMDEQYLAEQLRKLKLYEFYENMRKLLEVWFAETPSDEKMDFMTEVFFGSMQYGTQRGRVIAEAARDNSRSAGEQLLKKLSLFFPGVASMKNRYPWLEKYPVLLPAAWVMRFCRVLFRDRDKVQRIQERQKLASEENVSSYQKDLQYVGLDFFF